MAKMAAKRATARSDEEKLAEALRQLVAPAFKGMSVEVGTIARWGRMGVTFRWEGFADLLPEERFHRLTRVIPESFREKRLAGFIWLELTPKESIESFLKLPRSEDVAPRERAVFERLTIGGFFDGLRRRLGAVPEKKCEGDFRVAGKVLAGLKCTPRQAQDARLLFMRHRAFCDCQILVTALPALRGEKA